VSITVGKAITPDRYASRTDDHLIMREMIDEVMFEIQSITGQQYRNVYATKRKADTDVADSARNFTSV
jgi:1-acyl-sn-glycerol-3-phosphate acyltransferase